MSETATEVAEGTVVSIPVITQLQDNHDGGYTMNAYNNEDELIASFKEDDMTPERRQDILDGEDEYEDGYIERDTIEVRIMDDGSVQLAKHLSFHAGQ